MKIKRRSAARAYLTHRKLIFGICRQFVRRNGGEFVETVSEAHEHFMFIYHTHDPARQSLAADIEWRLPRRLLETRRLHLRRRGTWEEMPEDIGYEEPLYFDIEEFMDPLTPEARDVVKMALNPNPDIELEVLQAGEASPHNVRTAIRQYLRDLSWSANKIRESFSEIKNALLGTTEEQ